MKNIVPSFKRIPTFSHRPFMLLLWLVAFIPLISAQEPPTLCGQNSLETFSTVNDENETTLTSNLTETSWDGLNKYIGGTLVINSNFSINNCKIKLGANAKIEIGSAEFSSSFSQYFACRSSWYGFSIPSTSSGRGQFVFCQIEDAEYAFQMRSSSAFLLVFGSQINRNVVGLESSSTNLINTVWVGNTVDCTSPIEGASSASSVEGIRLVNVKAARIGIGDNAKATFVSWKNAFIKQQTGVYSSSSQVDIGLAQFERNTVAGVRSISGSRMGLHGGLDKKKWPPINFTDNEVDVNSIHSMLDVQYAHFQNCNRTNITSRSNTANEVIKILDSRFLLSNTYSEPGNPKFAIEMDRSVSGSRFKKASIRLL